jgi:NADH-quinone oxidoreductase subunit A
MPADFLPVLMLVIIAAFFSGVALFLPSIIGPHRPNPVKDLTYESGIKPIGSLQRRTHVQYYRTAMLFILFDIEVVFLYPWAVTFRKLKIFGLIEMAIFVAILLVGYIYIWRKGALEWD